MLVCFLDRSAEVGSLRVTELSCSATMNGDGLFRRLTRSTPCFGHKISNSVLRKLITDQFCFVFLHELVFATTSRLEGEVEKDRKRAGKNQRRGGFPVHRQIPVNS